MEKRKLGRSNIEISAMGLGCYAAGGHITVEGQPSAYGNRCDDDEVVRSLRVGFDSGVNFVDTSDVYGCGHAERLLRKAIGARRDSVVVATKFGFTYNEATREVGQPNNTPDYIRQACELSLRRLGTDYIDLYQYHVSDDIKGALVVMETLERLVEEGKIRSYGWSTVTTEAATLFASGANCVAIQHPMNIFEREVGITALCEEENLASICRAPLAMGLLTGKFTKDTRFADDDIRSGMWNLSIAERPEARVFEKIETIKELLTMDGRTLAQGALGYLWAKSENHIPIPGFTSVRQVKENIGALEFGLIEERIVNEINELVGECPGFTCA
uniref:Predicted oxidoreductase n=1 Tax=Candidatus Kentrum sp. TC TaxID=2126339 RepID=A0A450YJF4_9GAMM|nr:MAG: Predicted oxidoreductase [Candidatus Kentron sp. TC]